MWKDESGVVFCPDLPQTMARCLPTFGNESPESSKAASLLHWLTTAIQEFLLCPGFTQEYENWHNRVSRDILRDGQMWKSFQNISGSPFLAS